MVNQAKLAMAVIRYSVLHVVVQNNSSAYVVASP